MFLLAHISLVSFFFDLPGLFVGKRSSIVVVSLNVFAVLYVVVSAVYKLDYHAGWGCYGSGADISELDGGLCHGATAFIGEPGEYYAVDYPKHCTEAYAGNLEALSNCESPSAYSFSKTLHAVAHTISISAGMFLGKIPTKYDALIRTYNKKYDKL